MTRLTLVSALLALTFSAGFTRPAVEATQKLSTQTAAAPDQHERYETASEPDHGLSQVQSSTQHMMRMREQMMAEMKAADARLDALVRDMNAATGNARIDAVAAVLNELVQQRKAMHERMGKMSEHMTGGMKMHR
jgi:hypothetical protein